MLQRIVGVLALGLLLLPGMTAQAQALNVGYTDHERIIAAMPAFQQANQTLQREAQSDEDALRAMFEDYQERAERYQRQQALLSEERRAEREQELLALQQEIQDAEQKSNEKLQQRQIDLYAPIFEQVDDAIQSVAREQGLDIVLRSHAGPTQPIILYVNEDKIVNITLDVARKLGLDVDQVEEEGS